MAPSTSSNKLVGNILEWRDVTTERLNVGMLDAINKVQAVIEFSPDGKIEFANENFLKALGYTLDEVQGQHHSIFVDPVYRASPEYKAFWDKLRRGEYDAGQYKRIGKGGKEIWIQASYNPIIDANGKAFKVVKYATDITADKLRNADYEGQIAAIGKAQAVIEFSLDGKILNANENFLNALGYSLGEVERPAPFDFRRSGLPREPGIQGRSGRSSAAANTTPGSTSASARAARRSGSRPAITRSSTPTASRSRS